MHVWLGRASSVGNPLQEDIVAEQITMMEYIDPFTGEETKEIPKKK